MCSLWVSFMQQFNAAFFAYFELNKSFFGEIHIKALLSLLGKKSLTAVIGELAKNLELLFTQLLSPYIQALMRGFPPSTKLPLFLYKTIGTYEYFYAKLKPLLTYRDLKTEVFQSFREFGNTFCFVALLDQVLEHENVMNVVLSAPFLGLVSSDSDTPAEELFTLKQVMLQSKDFLAGSGTSVVNIFSLACVRFLGAGNNIDSSSFFSFFQDFAKLGETADQLYRPGCPPHSLVKILLKQFDKQLDAVRGEWRGSVPSNDVIEVDYCVEFYRIWGAIQFAICTPPFNVSEFTSR